MDLETATKVIVHIDKLIVEAISKGEGRDAMQQYEAAAVELHQASILLKAKAAIVGSLPQEVAEEILGL